MLPDSSTWWVITLPVIFTGTSSVSLASFGSVVSTLIVLSTLFVTLSTLASKSLYTTVYFNDIDIVSADVDTPSGLLA